MSVSLQGDISEVEEQSYTTNAGVETVAVSPFFFQRRRRQPAVHNPLMGNRSQTQIGVAYAIVAYHLGLIIDSAHSPLSSLHSTNGSGHNKYTDGNLTTCA